MTDRVSAFIVTLTEDMRDDNVADTITALSMVRGVASVAPVVADPAVWIAQVRADQEWRRRVYAVLNESVTKA